MEFGRGISYKFLWRVRCSPVVDVYLTVSALSCFNSVTASLPVATQLRMIILFQRVQSSSVEFIMQNILEVVDGNRTKKLAN